MIGSIIGDIVGSIYEFSNIRTKDFEFFGRYVEYTDDSILTLATADAILAGRLSQVTDYYVRYAEAYPTPMGGYGNSFQNWVIQKTGIGYAPAYNSCGNGSAMRVGPVGWAFDTKNDIMNAAKVSAEGTHNHPEGIKGAQATAMCIFLARKGVSKEEIQQCMEKDFGYRFPLTITELQKRYSWNGVDGEGNILMSLGVLIECNWKDNFRYYIANPESLKNETLNRWLLDTYTTAQELLQYSTLHDCILVEPLPSSQKCLTDILNAIKETKLIRLSYRSFKRNKSYTFPVAPYCLKSFQRRWYLLALSINDNKIRVYGLDRVEHLEILKEVFVLPQDFDAHAYFSSYFGVVIEDSKSIERVVIRAYGRQQHYLRSLPLHESQQEVFTCEEYADFELLVRSTYDLCMELLKLGNMVEVLQPATLRHEMHNWAKDLWKIYKND